MNIYDAVHTYEQGGKLPQHLKREARRVESQKRRARKRNLEDSLTFETWLRILYANSWACFFCKSTHRMTMEHITPLSMGGGTTEDNVLPCCFSCNTTLARKLN